ncbi:hypothetical protein ONS95_009556 [Cadophora gregata]|uniref:uncharacterized protein n=1 Tax=Cadophora gregata TaxID=51156 RepID=UPI0026DB9D25|nr:uncharacterized protein ONS95_009556 [Cadophora gregata]KAK0124607.1 hypothetical protein ONS95_009556 [Cadophora gregata]KAK0129536.1 hypothetical protein ONS96_000101 [Cadophora gregata f. sp. sojae]
MSRIKQRTTMTPDHITASTNRNQEVNLPRVDSKMDLSEHNNASQESSPPSPEMDSPAITPLTISFDTLISARPNSTSQNPIHLHPHRQFRSSFAAFSERRLRELKNDEIVQTLSEDEQKEKIRQEFETSDNNPVILLPGAKERLTDLQSERIPYEISTNYQYDPEELDDAVTDLRNMLGVQGFEKRQLVQCPTPFRKHVLKCRRRAVLVIGVPSRPRSETSRDSGSHMTDKNDGAGKDENDDEREKAREFAHSLGFEDVYTPDDYYAVYPNLAPAGCKPRRRMSAEAKKLYDGRNQKGPCVEIKAILIVNPNSKGLSNSPSENNDDSNAECKGTGQGLNTILPTKLIIPILKSHTGDLRIESPFNGKRGLPNEGWQQVWAPKVWFDGVGLGKERYEGFKGELEREWWGETGRRGCRGLVVLS